MRVTTICAKANRLWRAWLNLNTYYCKSRYTRIPSQKRSFRLLPCDSASVS
jgi:hypothetical protein